MQSTVLSRKIGLFCDAFYFYPDGRGRCVVLCYIQVRDDYGEELFERIAAASSKATTLLGSSQLELVPDAIVQALTARWPSKRVAVGLDAKLAWIPLSFFPDQPLDKIFAATQWLFAGTLVPALKAKKAKSKAE